MSEVRFYYECLCGHHYDSHLGKYGCPNCNGEHAGTLRRVKVPAVPATPAGAVQVPRAASAGSTRKATA